MSANLFFVRLKGNGGVFILFLIIMMLIGVNLCAVTMNRLVILVLH